jgi:hypothetical protein
MKILLSESQVESLKKNNIEQSIDEDLSAGSFIVYHRTRLTEKNIKSLNNGFMPGDGQAYGRGLYSTYDLNSQLRPNMSLYGKIIVEFSISKFDKILVLNADECKKIYGRVLSFDEQMKRMLKGNYVKFIKNINSSLIRKFIPNNGITGPIASGISDIQQFQLEVDGMIFSGSNDGKVLVLFETNLANPLRYTTDDGKTWKNIKTKESFKIGRDKRGYGKFLNYLEFKKTSLLNFDNFDRKNKIEIITQKVKNNIPFNEKSEYDFYIQNFRPSEEERENVEIKMVQEKYRTIHYIENPSEKVQLAAVQQDGNAIRGFISRNIEPSEKVQLVAVQKNAHLIKVIQNPSEQVQLAAVQREGYVIQFIQNPSEQVQLAAVQQEGDTIQYIENPSEQVQLAAVQENGNAIKYIENPSEQFQLAAVQQNGNAIRYIENPSEQVQLAAVQQNGAAIRHIENPSEQVQLAAVQQNGYAIAHIHSKGINPSEQLLHAAVNKIAAQEKNKTLNEDVFTYNDLNDDEKNTAYEIFKNSYENATGNSWDKIKFSSRASNWTFYGVKNKGFVVVRKQKSGMNKLTGVAGDLKSISVGVEELNKLNEPTWGMADKKIVNVLTGRYNFISPPAFVVKMLIKFIPDSVFGNTQYVVNKDGSITFNYSDVGDATKYFFGNKMYFQSLLKNVSMNSIVKFAIQKLIS